MGNHFPPEDPKSLRSSGINRDTYAHAWLTYLKILARHTLTHVIGPSPVAWWGGASLWGVLTYTLLAEHIRISGGEHLNALFFLCVLPWTQFGFAALFAAVKKGYSGYRRIPHILFMIVIPPLLLHALLYALIL